MFKIIVRTIDISMTREKQKAVSWYTSGQAVSGFHHQQNYDVTCSYRVHQLLYTYTLHGRAA